MHLLPDAGSTTGLAGWLAGSVASAAVRVGTAKYTGRACFLGQCRYVGYPGLFDGGGEEGAQINRYGKA